MSVSHQSNNHLLDYSVKPTQEKKLETDLELKGLLDKSIPLLHQIIANFEEDEVKTNSPINKMMIEERDKDLALLQKQLNQLSKLKLIDIPEDNGKTKSYCILADKAQGVTEKLSLIETNVVKNKLKNLLEKRPNAHAYINSPEKYQLAIKAILKLPKHGNNTAVQSEAFALNISRMLGFETTQFTVVAHNQAPALFVPFEKINLLQEYAQGETFYTLSNKSYSDYSTIKSVGEGLCRDQTLDDFGKMLAFMYLCCDPDAIGGYNQNKAIKDNKSFFIFDQVINDSEVFSIDSGLTLIANGINEYSRHLKGRNKSIIEDSTFENKLRGIENLIINREPILEMFDNIIRVYNMEIKYFKSIPQTKDTPSVKVLNELHDHAVKLRDIVDKRIQVLENNFSQYDNVTNKKILLLEKLLNGTRLFTEDGRAYKHPHVEETKNKIKQIKNYPDNIVVTFSKDIDADLIKRINHHANTNIKLNSNALEISHKDLVKITENTLTPENNSVFNLETNYFNIQDLKLLNLSFEKSKVRKILDLAENYLKPSSSIADNFGPIKEMDIALNQMLNGAKDKGLIKQVQLKFEMHKQQACQLIVSDEAINDKLTKAFESAIKLDRVNMFNNVIMNVIKNKQIKEPYITDFLEICAQLGNEAKDYSSSKIASENLAATLQRIEKQLAPEEKVQHTNVDIGKNSSNAGIFQQLAQASSGMQAAMLAAHADSKTETVKNRSIKPNTYIQQVVPVDKTDLVSTQTVAPTNRGKAR